MSNQLEQGGADAGQCYIPQVKSLPEPQSEGQFCVVSLPHSA